MFAWVRRMIKALYCWASIDSNTHMRELDVWYVNALYCSASIKHRVHVLSARIRYSRIHKVCISLTLNRSSATHRSQLGNTWCNTITFLFGTDTNVQPQTLSIRAIEIWSLANHSKSLRISVHYQDEHKLTNIKLCVSENKQQQIMIWHHYIAIISAQQ